MDEKNKQLLDQILKYAAERKIQIPADIVLKLSTIYAEDLYSELKQGQAPSEMEGKILMGTLRKLVEQIVLEEVPEFGLMNSGLVPAPGKAGLMLMSTGWKPYLIPSAPGGGGGGTGISDAPGDSQSYVRYNRTWIVMPPGVTQHSLLTGLDYASSGHTGFQASLTFPLSPTLGGTGIANAAGSTLTLGAATSITGGGTLGLGGFTFTVPATGSAVLGTGTATYIARWADANTLGNSVIRDNGVANVGINVAPSSNYGLSVYNNYSISGSLSIRGIYSRVLHDTADPIQYHIGMNTSVEWTGSGICITGLRGQEVSVTASGSAPSSSISGYYISTTAAVDFSAIRAISIFAWGQTGATKTLTDNYGIYIYSPTTTGTVVNQYGIYIANISGASTLNYAIYTGAGAVRFGDTLTTVGVLTIPNNPVIGGFTVTVPATGTTAMGAGTLTSATTNDVTGANHTHAITASTALVAAGTAQYQVLTTGANPYPAGWSDFYLDGTTGGKTVFAVTNTKTLTLTAADDYNLTIPATGTVAELQVANVFTTTQYITPTGAGSLTSISNLHPNLAAGASIYWNIGKSLSDNNMAQFQYHHAGDGWSTNYLTFNFYGNASIFTIHASGNFGIGTPDPGAKLDIASTATVGNTNVFFLRAPNLNAGGAIFEGYGKALSNNDIGFISYHHVGDGNTGNYLAFDFYGLASIFCVTAGGSVGVNTYSPASTFDVRGLNAAAGINSILGLTALGSGANGDGGSILYNGKSSTTAAQAMGLDQWYWVNATHASRTARRVFNVYDTAIREGLRIEASGTAPMIGFLGAAAVVRPLATTDLGVALSDLGLRVAGTAYPITTSGAVSFTGGVTTNGGRVEGVTTYTDTCNILTTDECVIFNKATAFTATMPAATVGQRFYFKNIGAGNVTLSFPGTDTVDEVDDDLIMTQYDSYTLICRLANKWVKV